MFSFVVKKKTATMEDRRVGNLEEVKRNEPGTSNSDSDEKGGAGCLSSIENSAALLA